MSLEDEMFEAVMNGTPEDVRALLDRGADIDGVGEGWLGSPVVLAANNSDDEMTRFLIDAGAALHPDLLATAAYSRRLRARRKPEHLVWLVDLLIGDESYDVNGVEGNPPLHLSDVETAAKLIDAGADVDRLNVDGETALHSAARHDLGDFAQLLLDRGANATIADAADFTPLDRARAEGSKDVAERLEAHLGVSGRFSLDDVDWTVVEDAIVSATKRALADLVTWDTGETFAGFCFQVDLKQGRFWACMGTVANLDGSPDDAWNAGDWDYAEFADVEHPRLSEVLVAAKTTPDKHEEILSCIARATLRLNAEEAFRGLELTPGFDVLVRHGRERHDEARARMQAAT